MGYVAFKYGRHWLVVNLLLLTSSSDALQLEHLLPLLFANHLNSLENP